jgi:hypothetical protein
LPLERERELNVKLNKTTGEFDFDKLANFFDADELTEWGFSDEEIPVFGGIDIDIKTKNNKPYKKTHVLISFPPELINEINEHLGYLTSLQEVEIEIGSN